MSKPTHRVCVEEPMSIAARRTKPGEEVKPRTKTIGAAWRAKGDTLQIKLELMPPFCYWAPDLKLVCFLIPPDENEASADAEVGAHDDDFPFE